ncbi:hypothetical protein Cha6605_4098 [Chamaesiphon minutus PCC 6605]|uniref:Uncharacterized protein n=1 Tax=Chamaesiphon minutus (strain ATCC 27169 / PCC 6605) TaxID=1173020 RepID=K9ULH0_CHAP6|nr:hypothetical protein Cha6605_4098 [Chamaesiphon minutus PCC 6605]
MHIKIAHRERDLNTFAPVSNMEVFLNVAGDRTIEAR